MFQYGRLVAAHSASNLVILLHAGCVTSRCLRFALGWKVRSDEELTCHEPDLILDLGRMLVEVAAPTLMLASGLVSTTSKHTHCFLLYRQGRAMALACMVDMVAWSAIC